MSLCYQQFKNIPLASTFFDSLRNDYIGFDVWFNKKSEQYAFVSYDKSLDINGFLYLKIENETIEDTEPKFPQKRRVKLGTFKIDAHGTKMGQRFIRKIIDFTIFHNVDEIYVTIFDKHKSLINLLEKYGFKLQARKIAKTQNGHEGVYLKQFNSYYNNIDENYPLIKLNQRNFLLSIHPKWHSRLLPDSILNNEKTLDLIHDVSHTNSIDKVYLTAMQGTESLRQGDNLLIYRTSDGLGSARFRSVVSSMCVVKEVKNINEFNNYNSFKNYCSAYSVFTDQELMQFYQTKRYRVIIKFTYNFPLLKRLTRQDIIDITHYSEKQYWGFFPLSDKNIKTILKQGLVNESLIID